MYLKGISIALALFAANISSSAQTAPELEYVLELNVNTGESFSIGKTGNRERVVIPITGGTFEGPRIRGKVLEGGADYQLADTENGRTDLEAIYCLRTDDGESIHVRNIGLVAGNYFYTSPKFESSANGKYSWLNNGIYVCRPSGFGEKSIKLKVWKICDADTSLCHINDWNPIPDILHEKSPRQGKVEVFNYKIRLDSTEIEKQAHVYLPYGYQAGDTATRYNVVYLMHGGGDNTTSFFADSRSPLPLTQVLDHLIESRLMKPVIVVTPTYYDGTQSGSGGMLQAAETTRRFHSEFREHLIPSLESHYNTHYTGDIDKSRDNRAFGGFSMGALATWYQLVYDAGAAKHYIPLSGDLWFYDIHGEKQPAGVAAAWLASKITQSGYADNFKVYAASGTDDIAGIPEMNLVKELSSIPEIFRMRGNNANLQMYMKNGGKHYYGDINEYLYRILPQIWPAEQ